MMKSLNGGPRLGDLIAISGTDAEQCRETMALLALDLHHAAGVKVEIVINSGVENVFLSELERRHQHPEVSQALSQSQYSGEIRIHPHCDLDCSLIEFSSFPACLTFVGRKCGDEGRLAVLVDLTQIHEAAQGFPESAAELLPALDKWRSYARMYGVPFFVSMNCDLRSARMAGLRKHFDAAIYVHADASGALCLSSISLEPRHEI